MIRKTINLKHLLKLRLVVARHSEQDMANWWNTKGLLGGMGSIALSRGFPKTHYFAQARIVFAVAKCRCEELFDPPGPSRQNLGELAESDCPYISLL